MLVSATAVEEVPMRAVALVLLLLARPAVALEFVSVGTGEVTGAYFAAARAICERVNLADRTGLRCSPESTAGSIYNLTALRDGQLDMALAQSDWQRHAWNGTAAFAAAGPMPELRSLMSLHAEPLTLLVRRDAGVRGFADLRNRRVDLGHPSSGRRATIGVLMRAYGIAPEAFAATFELQASAAIAELCAERIDATLLIVGHPNAAVARALRDCAVSIAPITGPEAAALVVEGSAYSSLVIPASTYPELAEDVRTFGVSATLVTLASMPEATAEVFVRETLNALPSLARRAPVLAGLDPAEMRSRGLSAPLHPGAARAFEAFLGRR
jgi:TRAP transporter TAXI family solute receptor